MKNLNPESKLNENRKMNVNLCEFEVFSVGITEE